MWLVHNWVKGHTKLDLITFNEKQIFEVFAAIISHRQEASACYEKRTTDKTMENARTMIKLHHPVISCIAANMGWARRV